MYYCLSNICSIFNIQNIIQNIYFPIIRDLRNFIVSKFFISLISSTKSFNNKIKKIEFIKKIFAEKKIAFLILFRSIVN